MGIGIAPPDRRLLAALSLDLAPALGLPCSIDGEWLDATFAFDAGRNQYYATRLLERLATTAAATGDGRFRILGVTPLDLFVPILTFVFGEAQLGGNCAVVSYHRLPEPGHPELLRERLLKEAVHELGHTFGLRHCQHWQCAMASSHSVERLDIKEAKLCPACAAAAAALQKGTAKNA